MSDHYQGVILHAGTPNETYTVYKHRSGKLPKQITPNRSLKEIRHSPDGFCWGYNGSGPAQLALAILLDCCPRDIAVISHQEFKTEVISKLNRYCNWTIGIEDIIVWTIAHKEPTVIETHAAITATMNDLFDPYRR